MGPPCHAVHVSLCVVVVVVHLMSMCMHVGLYHTFQDQGIECQGNGDFVADTPAVRKSFVCAQPNGRPLDTCPNQPGLDQVTNFMAYVVSMGGVAFMHRWLLRLLQKRMYLLDGNHRTHALHCSMSFAYASYPSLFDSV